MQINLLNMEDLNIYNVIWVDDEIDELLSPVEIKRLLRNHGIHIEPAHNSTEYREIMEHSYDRIDAVITDANMARSSDTPRNERDLSGFEDVKSCIEKYLARTLNPNIKIYQMEANPSAFRLTAKREMNYTLNDYIELFSNLHTNKQQGKKAPHKAIMLISIIDLIATHHIQTNEINFTEELEACFHQNWKRYVGKSTIFKPKAGTPYWHLNSEPFWQLIPYEGGYEKIVKLQKGSPYSSRTIRKHIKSAVIDQTLFQLLQEDVSRKLLRDTLINSLNK